MWWKNMKEGMGGWRKKEGIEEPQITEAQSGDGMVTGVHTVC